MHHLPSRYIPCDGRLTASAYFKSTLPAWGATRFIRELSATKRYFNPRSPPGERQIVFPETSSSNQISIHAPRMGSDFVLYLSAVNADIFQSTLPAWGATTFGASSGGSYEFQSTLPAWGATLNVNYFLTFV